MLIIGVIIAAVVFAFSGAYLSYCKSESSAFLLFMPLVALVLGFLWAVLVRQLHNNRSAVMAASLIWDVTVVIIYVIFPLLLSYKPNEWLVAGFVLSVLGIACLQLGIE